MSDGASSLLLKSVRLRDVIPDDLPTLFRHQLDPESNRLAAVNPRNSAQFDTLWAKILNDPNIVANAILADDILVGHISCFEMDGHNAVGYWIGRECWGRGIATRALALFLEQVVIRPLHARVARHNVASIRVLERCGFVMSGYQESPGDDRYCACEETVLVLV